MQHVILSYFIKNNEKYSFLEKLMTLSHIEIKNVNFSNTLPFALIAGPCAMESEAHTLDMAGQLKEPYTDTYVFAFLSNY